MTTTTTNWRPCKKITLTIARCLTDVDVHARGGIIQTLEGPAPFQTGDYLACDAKGEYPISKDTLEGGSYVKVQDLTNGWVSYQPCDIREARQVMTSFTLNGQHGKAGDYQVKRGEKIRIVDRTIFESSYHFLDEEEERR